MCVGCNLNSWVAGGRPDTTVASCSAQGTTGVWQTADGDKWTIKDDCSGSEIKCAYVFDAFYVQDGKVIINLQKSSNDVGCLNAPQTHQCDFVVNGASQIKVTCDLIHYTLSK